MTQDTQPLETVTRAEADNLVRDSVSRSKLAAIACAVPAALLTAATGILQYVKDKVDPEFVSRSLDLVPPERVQDLYDGASAVSLIMALVLASMSARKTTDAVLTRRGYDADSVGYMAEKYSRQIE